jgi:hypothetical protein
MVEVLPDPHKKPVLVHGIINNILSEIQQYFICQHKRWQIGIFEKLKIKAQQVTDPVYESGFPCSMVVLDLLYPSLFIPEPLRDLDLTVAGTEKKLLVDPVLVHPNTPVGSGGREPGMGIACCPGHSFLDPEICSNP